MNTDQYELDTARAKTPAERLRIRADLIDAEANHEPIYEVVESCSVKLWPASAGDVLRAMLTEEWEKRFVTKRRPVLVIPALELFEGPMTEAPELGETYYTAPAISNGEAAQHIWAGDCADLEWLAAGRVFRTQEGADRLANHFREALKMAKEDRS